MFLIILLILFILIILILFYLEIPRYCYVNNYSYKSLKKLDSVYDKLPKIKGRCVISLTTTPDRIYLIIPTLCSVLSQSKRVDEIALNIPYKSMKGIRYKIPKWLRGLKHVKIYRVGEDLGPSTKLLPTEIRESSQTKIIVIDDDNIYGSQLVESLVKGFKKNGCRKVITCYGSKINSNGWERHKQFFAGGGNVDVLFGCGGYILTPKMLPRQVHNYKGAPKGAKFVDDNWISGWLRYNKVEIYMMGLKHGCNFFPSWKSIDSISLSGSVNKNNKHENKLNKWFDANQ